MIHLLQSRRHPDCLFEARLLQILCYPHQVAAKAEITCQYECVSSVPMRQGSAGLAETSLKTSAILELFILAMTACLPDAYSAGLLGL